MNQLAESSDGQKRWTAILFADLANSTSISEQIGPERTYALLKDLIRKSWNIIEQFDGHPIDFAGDSILAVFGAPLAVENASLQACKAAIALQAQVARSQNEFQEKYGISPKFRIGISGGVVIVGNLGMDTKMDMNVLGDPVNFAARLQTMAKAGEIYCSASIISQVGEFVKAESLGLQPLRGFSQPHEVFRLDDLAENISGLEGRLRRGTPFFFGRKDELDILLDWTKSSSGGRGMIDIHAPAGGGKSRLLHEFTKVLPPEIRILTGNCNRDVQSVTLSPVFDIIRAEIGWEAGQSRDQLTRGVTELLGGAERGLNFLVSRIGAFQTEPADETADNALSIRTLTRKILLKISSNPSRLMVIEDIHWIDPITEEVLQSLVQEPATGIRIALTRRSEFRRKWLDGSGWKALPLRPLGQASLRGMVSALLNQDTVSDHLLAFVSEKSEGNPLFIEEIVRYLEHTGQLLEQANELQLALRDDALSVVGNLQNLVFSRFDTLSETFKSQLLFAAARGRRFTSRFLEGCGATSAQVRLCTDAAQDAGLIEPDPSGEEGSWRFSHALIQTAIYQTVLEERKLAIHTRVAETIERIEAANLTTHVEELAFHFNEARNGEKTVHYLWKASEKAFAVYSVDQVDQNLDAAFALISRHPETVSDSLYGEMLLLWCRSLDIFGNFRKLNEVMLKYADRLLATEPTRSLAMCLTLQAMARCHAASFPESVRMIEDAARISAEIDDPLCIAWGKVAKMRIFLDSGHASFDEIAQLYQDVRAMDEVQSDIHLIQLAIYTMQAAYRSRGAFAQAVELNETLLELGRTLPDSRAMAMGGWAKVILLSFASDVEGTYQAAQESLQYSIPETADWRVATMGRISSRALRGDADFSPEEFLPHIEKALFHEDMTLCNALRLNYSLGLMSKGKFAEGWKHFLIFRAIFEKCGINEFKRYVVLREAEIMLAIAGILPSTGEKPKMGLRDVLTILRLRLTARSRAEKLLRDFSEEPAIPTCAARARAHFGLGLIARSRKNEGKAAEFFQKSRQAFAINEMDVWVAELDKLMAA